MAFATPYISLQHDIDSRWQNLLDIPYETTNTTHPKTFLLQWNRVQNKWSESLRGRKTYATSKKNIFLENAPWFSPVGMCGFTFPRQMQPFHNCRGSIRFGFRILNPGYPVIRSWLSLVSVIELSGYWQDISDFSLHLFHQTDIIVSEYLIPRGRFIGAQPDSNPRP